jgi:hypothetical protein
MGVDRQRVWEQRPDPVMLFMFPVWGGGVRGCCFPPKIHWLLQLVSQDSIQCWSLFPEFAPSETNEHSSTVTVVHSLKQGRAWTSRGGAY